MQQKRISDIARIRRGASPRPIDDPKYFGGDVGWIRIADVSASKKYLRQTTQYVSPLGESLSVRVDKGDLIMSIAGTVGRPIIVDIPACIHDGFVQIYDLKEMCTEFLYYYLKHIEKTLNRYGQSGTQTNLNTSIIGNIPFNWFPQAEQGRIAEVLRSTDEAIGQTEALVAKYQRIKTGLMQDLLTKGIDEHGNVRHEETHSFKDSPLGKIPTEWDVTVVGSLCTEIVVGIVIKPTQYYRDSGIPMLRSFNIKEGAIEMRDLVYMSEEDNEKLSKSKLKEGDVVSVRTGYPGTSAVVTNAIAGCNCIDLVISRVRDNLLNPSFLATWINSPIAKRQILNHQGGNAQQHFNVGQMKELLIFKVPIEEQNRILKLLQMTEENIINYQHGLAKLNLIKTGLMQDLLSGKVRVNVN